MSKVEVETNNEDVEVPMSQSDIECLLDLKMVVLESVSEEVKVYRLTRDARVLLGSLRSD